MITPLFKKKVPLVFLSMVGLSLWCAVVNAQNPEVIQLRKGGQQTLKMEDLTRVAIADEGIADVRIISDGRELLLIGLSEGATDITLWDSKGNQRIMKVVVGRSVQDLTAEIKGLVEEIEGVKVNAVGNKVVLDGSVLTEDDKKRIDMITQSYPEVLNLVTLSRGSQAELLESAIKEAINMPQVNVRATGNKVIIEGVVFNEADKARAEKVAGTYVSEVVNLLEVSQEMIEVDVHFAQVDYSKGKDIGGNILKDLKITGDIAGGSGIPSTTSFGLALNALSKLNFLVSKGAGQIVSQPHLSTISGKSASFHSGGEIGYEVSGMGAADVKWKKYGLILNIQPVLESSGDIKTHIYIEVSSPVATGGTAEKAFTVFNTESDLVCKQGESVVISGLVQSIKNKFQEKTPILGSIPILDFFFKHRTADDVNKQLVVLITPTVTTVAKIKAAPLSKTYEETLKKSEEDVDLEGR